MSKKKRKSRKKLNIFSSFKTHFKNEKVKSSIGLICVGGSLYLLMSFLSFLNTGGADRSKLDIPVGEFFRNPNISVANMGGKSGAYLADLFINQGFGIAAFSIIFLVFIYGMRLLNARILPLKKTLFHTALITIWLSVLLGFLLNDYTNDFYISFGGAHGFYVSKWLTAALGWFGTLLFLILVFAIYMVSNFNLPIIKDKIFILFKNKSKIDSEESSEEEVSELEDNSEEALEEEQEITTEDELTISYTTASEEEQVEGISDDDALNFTISKTPTHTKSEETIEEENEEEERLTLDIEKRVDEEHVDNKVNLPQGDYDPKLDLSSYKLPVFDLLDAHDSSQTEVTEQELIDNKNQIVQTLNDYKIQIKSIKATVGPTITLYEIVPMPGVRISKIKNLEDDIALSLSALGIRIIAPIPGKGTVGIEVPNSKPQVVSMRSIISSKKFQNSKYDLAVAIGKTISNETYVFDLAKSPHLLVAGATGQGKSVGLNAIITSLLYKKHPSQLKFVFIDPKKVELNIYSKIERHFLAKLPDEEEPIITDVDKVVNTLNSLTIEMDERYDLLKKAYTRNIKEYNHKFVKRRLNPEKGHRFLPYIVVVIDEFADLIMTAGKEVELPIARIAQLARAVGIHMIIATQRPSTNIITGVIKANFPSRIAFKVASMIDSRTILDSPGANQLIGRGDMLITEGSDLIRVQCAFVDTPEVEKITSYIGEQRGYPSAMLLPEYVGENDDGIKPGEVDLTKTDVLFEDAAKVVVSAQSGSTSLIQRRFSIGYNRAGRIIDQLEAAGIVGPFEGSKARQVLVHDELELMRILEHIE